METKETKFAKAVTVYCTGISVEEVPGSKEDVKRITFTTDIGDITWKPKIEREEYRDGIKFLTKSEMKRSELPIKIKELGSLIASKGKVKIIVDYSIMNVNKDGQLKQYKFITSAKTFGKWKIEAENN